ncbi:MAG: tRNA nucleotidyltransferase [Clostridia bacterium]|nr:tRNA nucleotidyltransferase [Clostridia bacterium]
MYATNAEMARKIAEKVCKLGGRTFFVGGYVRDAIQGRSSKDIDIEVHGITPRDLCEILDSLGKRIEIGESFGIFGLKGYSLDIAMPRKEKNRGHGHRDFEVFVDPFIGTEGASRRRDFTVNAMMQDVLTGEIIDHFGGKSDLEKGIIRHVDEETFAEDPLRVLRCAQFAARFEFEIAPETISLCRTMNLSALSKERIMGEMEKALLKAHKPSIFFETLREMNALDIWFPELKALIGVEQNPKHHAEGDVWVHTMMVLDVATEYIPYVGNPLGFMLSVVCHDFGKAVCTKIVNGEIHAYKHEDEGIPIAERFMRRITNEKDLIRYVLNMTEHHMRPNVLAADNSAIKSTNKLFDMSVDPKGLICIAIADGLGKIAPREYVSYNDFFRKRYEIFEEYMSRPFVTGKDLIDAGITPNEKFSDYLSYAHKLRLAGVEKESALKQTLAYARKK